MKQNKKKFYNLLSVVAALACVCCLIFVLGYKWKNAEAEKKYDDLRQNVEANAGETTVTETENKSQVETEADEEAKLQEIETAEFTGEIDAPAPEIPEEVLTDVEENPVDFEKLQEINPELYAWIRIPNTQIDYPIAQHEGEEQDFYLHHNMYQEPEFAGCIYTENKNSKDFNDPVTVLYGHNMKNGSMFQNLRYFLDEQFFEENKYVYIYTPDETRVYEIVSAFPYDDRNIMSSFDFSDKEEFDKYLEVCQYPRSMEAMVRDDVKLDENSKLITLSTCIANQTDQRLLVQAVLMYEENEN